MYKGQFCPPRFLAELIMNRPDLKEDLIELGQFTETNYEKSRWMADMASRMAESYHSIADSEVETDKKENNQVNFVPESTSSDGTSGTNIIKGVKRFL